MAPNESPSTKQVPLLQFIIALLLVKSKPSTLSCTEFLKQLASNIKEGPRPDRSTQADAHVDMTAYWRNKAQRLEEESATLKEQNADLKAKNAALKEQESQHRKKVSELLGSKDVPMQNSAELEHSAPSQSLKRTTDRALGEEVRGPSAKRPRTVVGERDAVLPDPAFDKNGFEWDELGENLLDNLYKLNGSSIARRGNLLGPRDLASILSNAATDICRHVSKVDLPANLQDITNTRLVAVTPRSKQVAATYPQTKTEDIVEQRLLVIRQTLPHFLVHLHTLSQFSGTENLCETVICKYINIFRVLFQRVCDLAVSNAKSNQHRQKTGKELDTGREKQFSMSSSDDRSAIPTIIMGLCKLAVSMLCCLDAIKSTHRKVLEGCLHLLMTTTGKALESFTIGGRPYGIQWDAKSMSTAASEAEAFEAQAPYLIWMLECTQRFNLSVSLAPNATDARIRLQNTLVKAVYGEHARDSFEPSLEPPDFPTDDEILTEIDGHIGQADVRDWFKNEVWRLVGWDVLRQPGRDNVGTD